MNHIFIMIIAIVGGALGLLTCIGIVAGMIGTIVYKCYRRFRFGISMYE